MAMGVACYVIAAKGFDASEGDRGRAAAAGDEPLKTIPHYVPGSALTGDLRITCETSAEPLMKAWVDRFAKFQPDIELIAKGTSPIASVPMVMSGAYEVGFPARELWVSEEESFRKIRGYDATVVVVGLGAHGTAGLTPALGVYVNASNPLEKITLEQLDAIYSDARRRGGAKAITTWGDLGLTGEWASRPINAYIHRLPNGVDYFIEKTVCQGADFKRSVKQLPMRRGKLGPDEVVADVAVHDPAAIGFGCLGNVIPGMKTLALAETSRGPYYSGTLEEVQRMEYPFARPIYMVVDREPGKPLPPKIKEFLSFVLSQEGQDAIVASDGWLPLPPSVAAAERAKLP